jgi:hypothetical protein
MAGLIRVTCSCFIYIMYEAHCKPRAGLRYKDAFGAVIAFVHPTLHSDRATFEGRLERAYMEDASCVNASRNKTPIWAFWGLKLTLI